MEFSPKTRLPAPTIALPACELLSLLTDSAEADEQVGSIVATMLLDAILCLNKEGA